jgi:hypothetical protein
MVPKGHWNKSANKKCWAMFKEEIDYKLTNVSDIMKHQTCLTSPEREKIENTLFNFQPLFQGMRGEYHSEPIKLELLPGSKPFYSKPFLIP